MRAIYVDMDGVLCDFATPALMAQGLSREAAIKRLNDWPTGLSLASVVTDQKTYLSDPGVKELADDLFWNRIVSMRDEFWDQIESYPWLELLVSKLNRLSVPWFICSSPGNNATIAKCKVQWLHRFFGESFDRFILTHYKHTLACPGSILIDDDDRQIERFNALGGRGYLFPTPWNSAGAFNPNFFTFIPGLDVLTSVGP